MCYDVRRPWDGLQTLTRASWHSSCSGDVVAAHGRWSVGHARLSLLLDRQAQCHRGWMRCRPDLSSIVLCMAVLSQKWPASFTSVALRGCSADLPARVFC
jgi:hypothetical protein